MLPLLRIEPWRSIDPLSSYDIMTRSNFRTSHKHALRSSCWTTAWVKCLSGVGPEQVGTQRLGTCIARGTTRGLGGRNGYQVHKG